jgi:dihydroceramide fatty acyl 2-hydroxylase
MPPPALLDLSAPLVVQVGDLADEYDGWVHRSIKPKGSLRLFHNPILEAFSHTPWWLVPVVWVPISLTLAGFALFGLGLGLRGFLVSAFVGLVLWTMLEYLLHRFLFHYRPRTGWGRRVHFLAHGIHHLDPWDPTRLVFPPIAALAIAVPVFGVLYLGSIALVPAAKLATALAAMFGLLVGYLFYDMTHYYTHHVRPRSRWGKFLKAYHLAHHHKYPRRMFGVSQPFWDLVFRTGRP